MLLDSSISVEISPEPSTENKIDILKEMADFVFMSKYSRYDENLKRRETWDETCYRVESMHLKKFKHLPNELLAKIHWAFDLVRQKRVIPSMRAMQYSGTAIEANNLKNFNCCTRHIDSIRAFSEFTFSLLCGNGVGIGLSKRFLSRLPDLVDASNKNGTVVTYVVQDDIQGWADSIEALLLCYFRGTAYSGRKLVFDYSRIRPKGAKLKTSGGLAPGYIPLKNAHIKIKKYLDYIIEELKINRLRSIDAYDILMHIADCVVSGGSRRSACSIVFDKDDQDMLTAKTGNWFEENPQRARSNNSILLTRNEFSLEDFTEIINNTKMCGEPGFVFADKEAVEQGVLYNPCVSGDTQIITKEYGIVEIEKVSGLKVTIWNGFEWSEVEPKITGYNKKLLHIHLSNGKSLKCTENHTWYLSNEILRLFDIGKKNRLYNNNEIKKETKDLKLGDIVSIGYNPDGTVTDSEDVYISAIWEAGNAEKVYCFTEPKKHLGVFNGILTGQCFEISFIPIQDGVPGLQVCNLSSINGEKVKTKEEFFEAIEAATIIGTLQASYTDFNYLSPIAKQLSDEEGLLGVSITAMMSNPDILLNPKIQQEGALEVVKINKEWAKYLGIKQAARTTCIKPEGTGTLALGSVSPGIHPAHSYKFFRRIQMNQQDKIYQWFKRNNPKACEKSVWNPNGVDDVVTFPIEISKKHLVKNDLTAIQHLDYIRLTQIHWVNCGTTEVNKKPITHNVSCTVIVKDNEWDEVINYLYENQGCFAAVSLISSSGDKIYQQAPFEAVVTEEDEEKFKKLVESFRHVDYTQMMESNDNTSLQSEASCVGGACLI